MTIQSLRHLNFQLQKTVLNGDYRGCKKWIEQGARVNTITVCSPEETWYRDSILSSLEKTDSFMLKLLLRNGLSIQVKMNKHLVARLDTMQQEIVKENRLRHKEIMTCTELLPCVLI